MNCATLCLSFFLYKTVTEMRAILLMRPRISITGCVRPSVRRSVSPSVKLSKIIKFCLRRGLIYHPQPNVHQSLPRHHCHHHYCHHHHRHCHYHHHLMLHRNASSFITMIFIVVVITVVVIVVDDVFL